VAVECQNHRLTRNLGQVQNGSELDPSITRLLVEPLHITTFIVLKFKFPLHMEVTVKTPGLSEGS
jgi:hypothetical protein